MEADCKESTMDKKLPSEPVDLSQLILSLSRQISNQTQSIQDQLSQQNSVLQDQSVQNELRFQTVIQENEEFKRSVRSELDQLKTMLASSVPAVLPKSEPSSVLSSGSNVSLGNSSSTLPLDSNTQALSSGTSTTLSSSLPSSSTNTSSSIDNQVMLMLAESFSKLSSVLVVDKGTESKVEWPKFSGDSKLFKAWYLAIVAQISIPPWKVACSGDHSCQDSPILGQYSSYAQ